MSWTWRYESLDGSEIADSDDRLAPPTFPTQADAETWVGEVWRQLLEQGVDQVSLLEDDRIVYGPMSLHAP